jgi:hypothetical protein
MTQALRLAAGQMRVQPRSRREVSTIFVDNPVEKQWRIPATARGFFLFPLCAFAQAAPFDGGKQRNSPRSPMVAQLCTNSVPCAALGGEAGKAAVTAKFPERGRLDFLRATG